MPISIPAFLSCLLLIGSVHAQVSAPNCTDNTFSWVGSVVSDARFVSITIRYSPRAGVVIDVQLPQTKSLLGHGVSVGVVQQRRSVDTPLVHRRRSYQHVQSSMFQRYCRESHTRDQVAPIWAIHANAIQSCTTSSAHAMRARESRGRRALTSHVFACIPPNDHSVISYSEWSFNCTTVATPGT